MGLDLASDVILRWDSSSSCAGLLESGGIDAVWLPQPEEAVAAACRAAGVQVVAKDGIRLRKPEEMGGAGRGESAAMRAGVWPGAHSASRGSDGAFIAGATARAWVDANGYLIAWLRAVYPDAAPLLGYLPDADAGVTANRAINYESLELALTEARAAGGNWIVAPDRPYREALVGGDQRALSAWKQMGQTARWLKQQSALFRRPPVETITVLVEAGETTAELANLMCRQSASPELVSSTRVPAPDAALRPVVVTAGIRPPSPDLRRLLLAHAAGGATVVSDAWEPEAWWRAGGLKLERAFEDREFHVLGKGRIVAYKQPISDPGDFALDVLDLAGERRAVRIWDVPAAVAAVAHGEGRSAILRVVNYGSPARSEFMVHVHGTFRSATLLRPENGPLALALRRRWESTEIMLPALKRVAVVVFE